MGYEKIKRLALVGLLFFVSCSKSGIGSIEKRCTQVKKEMVVTLKSIESLQDLKKSSSQLKKLHLQLAELIEERTELKGAENSSVGQDPEQRELSDELKEQIYRVLEYEGAREVMMDIQKEARRSLDAFSARIKD